MYWAYACLVTFSTLRHRRRFPVIHPTHRSVSPTTTTRRLVFKSGNRKDSRITTGAQVSAILSATITLRMLLRCPPSTCGIGTTTEHPRFRIETTHSLETIEIHQPVARDRYSKPRNISYQLRLCDASKRLEVTSSCAKAHFETLACVCQSLWRQDIRQTPTTWTLLQLQSETAVGAINSIAQARPSITAKALPAFVNGMNLCQPFLPLLVLSVKQQRMVWLLRPAEMLQHLH